MSPGPMQVVWPIGHLAFQGLARGVLVQGDTSDQGASGCHLLQKETAGKLE